MSRITPLLPDDQPSWHQLWMAYQQFYRVEIPEGVTLNTWQKMQAGTIHGLGARDPAGRLVGIVHYLFHEDSWSMAPACYLQDLYVDPAQRGGGHGRRLIEAVALAARAAGASAPYWLTHESNTSARKLYDRLGRNHGFIQYAYLDPRGEP